MFRRGRAGLQRGCESPDSTLLARLPSRIEVKNKMKKKNGPTKESRNEAERTRTIVEGITPIIQGTLRNRIIREGDRDGEFFLLPIAQHHQSTFIIVKVEIKRRKKNRLPFCNHESSIVRRSRYLTIEPIFNHRPGREIVVVGIHLTLVLSRSQSLCLTNNAIADL